jgi:hypothetical protein
MFKCHLWSDPNRKFSSGEVNAISDPGRHRHDHGSMLLIIVMQGLQAFQMIVGEELLCDVGSRSSSF